MSGKGSLTISIIETDSTNVQNHPNFSQNGSYLNIKLVLSF